MPRAAGWGRDPDVRSYRDTSTKPSSFRQSPLQSALGSSVSRADFREICIICAQNGPGKGQQSRADESGVAFRRYRFHHPDPARCPLYRRTNDGALVRTKADRVPTEKFITRPLSAPFLGTLSGIPNCELVRECTLTFLYFPEGQTTLFLCFADLFAHVRRVFSSFCSLSNSSNRDESLRRFGRFLGSFARYRDCWWHHLMYRIKN